MSQEPNNIIQVHLTKDDLGVLVLTLHDMERKMLKNIRNDEDLAMAYPVAKLLTQLDTAIHALGQCKADSSGCAYEENLVKHHRIFGKFIEAEIKPGNKTV